MTTVLNRPAAARPLSMRLFDEPGSTTGRRGPHVGSSTYDLDQQIRVAADGSPLVWSAAPESSTYINDDGRETDYTDPYN